MLAVIGINFLCYTIDQCLEINFLISKFVCLFVDYLCTHVITHAKGNENWARFINSLIQVKTRKPHCCQSSTNMIANTVYIYLHL